VDRSKNQLIALSAQVFSPAAPIDQYRLFAGRVRQVREVLTAASQRGMHVILFGERGVGKTSLANILSELILVDGVRSLNSGTVNCDASDDFNSLWRKIFRELTVYSESQDAPGVDASTMDRLLSDTVTPDDIRFLLDRIPQPVMIVLDEIDRLAKPDVTTLLADTIKTLSDHSVDATLVFVGVADSVDDLIAEHQSVERALRQIRMPRMSLDELYEILDKGVNELEMTIDEGARDRIARLSEGLPTYTHLLALEAVQRAIIDDRTKVMIPDVEAAVKEAVENSQQSIRSVYHKAVSSPRRDNLFGHVLVACALAPTDFMGFFTAADVREPMTAIKKKRYEIPAFSRHLNDFTEPQRGPILQKFGTARKFRFRFINPMMQPYVILHGLANGLVDEQTVQRLQSRQAQIGRER
jgi:energy-coupling factor transporter ATP-binding protein EcfA2